MGPAFYALREEPLPIYLIVPRNIPSLMMPSIYIFNDKRLGIPLLLRLSHDGEFLFLTGECYDPYRAACADYGHRG